jgi:hypothetical protein
MVGQGYWLGSWEIGVEDEEVRKRGWWNGGLKSSDGMRSRKRKRRVGGKRGHNSWKRNASVGYLVEVGKDMIAEAGRSRDGRWKAGSRRWEEADLAKTETDPTTRMDGVAIKGGGGRPDAELPRGVAPAESGIGKVHATVEVGR